MENFYSSLYCQDCSDEDPRLWRYFARSLIPNHRSMWRPPMLVTDHQSATNSKCKCQIRTFASIFNKFQMQMPYPHICLYFQQNPNANAGSAHLPLFLTKCGHKKLATYWTHYVDTRFYQETAKICSVKTAWQKTISFETWQPKHKAAYKGRLGSTHGLRKRPT